MSGVIGGGSGVKVSGTGVSVSVGGGRGVFVSVGEGRGLLVLVGRGVLVGSGLGVEVGGILGARVLVGCLCGICVGGMTTGEEVTVGDEVGVGVREGRRIGVSSKLIVDNACTVSAETVLILLTARSTILPGPSAKGVGWFGAERAIAEVMHKRLIPKIPAATTPKRLV